ncbi:hypothetical protein ASPACDRAFT_121159 [Aspergillus aculeatus ATCC 16872]|uniref:DUF1479 domain protein n=1 Tax=Aspergillus aculeatus (strain ATCC 16872 / CBS 172.66 / WB 5094) TaxID=690307 RepID=A0A1L9WR11_ASPA1|nr:uncharacterized protein ASPACDRAFT_121159 [Aspergillus aculeatus ATCC 16872]OJJ98613.1 hypothetical protein ASPACDRAFT_121159 [Aspergillus aculeatus ATCC 16872]
MHTSQVQTASLRPALRILSKPRAHRQLATSTQTPRKEGDISSVFVSLSGVKEQALPPRFADQKRRLIAGREDQVKQSWDRLLCRLRDEVGLIATRGSDIIPSIDFKDIHVAPSKFQDELRKRGVAVVRGVIPESEARAYKEEIEAYVRANPQTRAFPPQDPQVFELYWSQPQMRARLHPHMLQTQQFLMSFWHSREEDALISPTHPLTYADRLRIRQPGDAGFALGPHVDGGSVERWEDSGYGLGKVYQRIWEGQWEEYDPWEASCRVPAVADLYYGAGACSMFRMFQGWLSMSHTGPREGTLLVNPLLSMATAYYLLRPFFEPISSPPAGDCSRLALETYLDPTNWRLEQSMSSKLEGATPGYAQELSDILHPHLRLNKTMVHMPKIAPGDYVAWHCDTIHSVDKVHQGRGDSSVLYIPACPVTEANAQYVRRQREDFLNGVPPPDFPGGKGESEHIGRTTQADLARYTNEQGLRSLGLEKWNTEEKNLKQGQRGVLNRADEIMGF